MPKAHYTVTVIVNEVIPPSPGKQTYGRPQESEPATSKETYEVTKVVARADDKKTAVEKAIRMLEAEGEDDTDGQ